MKHLPILKRLVHRLLRKSPASSEGTPLSPGAVLIVDDHPLNGVVLEAMAHEAMGGQHAVRIAHTLERGMEIGEQIAPALILLDLGLPGCVGLQSLYRMRKRFPDTAIVIISSEDAEPLINEALDAGIRGYIPKSTPATELLQALKLIISGVIYVPPSVRASRARGRAEKGDGLQQGTAEKSLSTRQMEVLRLAIDGLSNRDIAVKLGIAEGTVKQHLHQAFRALGVNSRHEAVTALARRGIPLY